ncbi:MAG: hypothetical protein WD271_05580 [Acidimicrobiia bacterium]
MISGATFGGADPTYLQIDNNAATGNFPVDLLWDGTGHHVTFFHNTCGTSAPPGFC